MTKVGTRRFFFVGTLLFAGIFVALTIHTHTTISARTHPENITDAVRRGLAVWGRYNCENCHTLMGEGAYYAPDLTKIVAQRGDAYLTRFLADPSAFYSEERDGRLMPTLGLSAGEISDVIAFLEWVGHVDLNGWPPRPILVAGVSARGLPGLAGESTAADPASRGRAVFNGPGLCATCHSLEPGIKLVGPSLGGIGSRAAERLADPGYHGSARSAEDYLRESIVAPSAFVVPGGVFATPEGASFMPDTMAKTLSPGQVDELVAYLASLR